MTGPGVHRRLGARAMRALKAFRSARLSAFFREIAVIVLGVLIALSAEQWLSGVNDRAAAAEARTNIRGELAENLGRMAQRDATRACIDRRIEEIAALLDGIDGGSRPAPLSWIGRPQIWPMETSRWNAAASAGRASLLEPREQAEFGALYANVLDFQQNQSVEQLAWAQLRGLAGRASLSPPVAARMREALQTARYTAWLIKINSAQARADAARLGIVPHTEWRGTRSICIASDTPVERARAAAGRTLGIDEPL